MAKSTKKQRIKMFKPGTLKRVVQFCGLGPATVLFFVLFFVCATAFYLTSSGMYSFWDGIWYAFQVYTTIGFGDLGTPSVTAQVFAIVLSVYSVFYLALITGAVVSYCSEVIKIRHEGTLSHYADKLENLDKLSHEELAALSGQVKRFVDKNTK